jgi:phage tail sheath protein FI
MQSLNESAGDCRRGPAGSRDNSRSARAGTAERGLFDFPIDAEARAASTDVLDATGRESARAAAAGGGTKTLQEALIDDRELRQGTVKCGCRITLSSAG